MNDPAAHTISTEKVETVLRQELARGDAAAETVMPILRHLLANDSSSVFSDDIIARVRGMAGDIARQLLDALVQAEDETGQGSVHETGAINALTSLFLESPALMAHLHALAMEWQLTERLHARFSLDQVLSPLVQAQVASSNEQTASLAMRVLSAQARFCQSQRRMTLSLYELPGDHLHCVLLAMRSLAGSDEGADQRAASAEAAIRSRYDEAASRLGLMTRLVMGMGSGALAALSLTHAGVGLFLTALGIGSAQDRDAATLSTSDGQLARLALALRSAGMKPEGIAEQFLTLHPEVALPEGFERLGADHAASILAGGLAYPGG